MKKSSRKIGKIQLPNIVYTNVQNAKRIRVELPIERRAKRLADEYASQEHFPIIKKRLLSIKAFISSTVLNEIFSALDADDTVKASALLLEFYYDPHYFKHYKNADEKVVATIMEDDYKKLLLSLKEFLARYINLL